MLCTYLLLIAIVGIILSDILLNICHFLLKSLCIFFGRFICSFKGCLASLHSLIVSTDFRCVNGFWIKPHFAEHTLSTVIQDKLCFVHTEISVRILGFLILFLKGFIVSVLFRIEEQFGDFFHLMLQLYKLGTGGLCLGCFFINLLLKLRKIICGRIAGSGSLEVFDRSPVLQTRAVLKSFSGSVYKCSVCAGTGEDIFFWYLDSCFLLGGFCDFLLL